MQLRNGEHVLDAIRPTFDPNLDIATVVFSHVQCVKTRVNLALVSKLWRDASKTAAAYPLEFDFDAFPGIDSWKRESLIIDMIANDEALSLPYERVVGLLGETAEYVCNYAASRGSVRLLKWARENNCDWSTDTCHCAALHGHLPLSSTCTRTGALGTTERAITPPITNAGTVCSTRWITSARIRGRYTPKDTRSTSDEIRTINRRPVINHKVSKKELY